jgi:hypothetical protein
VPALPHEALLCIPLEIWVESVPLRGKMRYNVGAINRVPELVGVLRGATVRVFRAAYSAESYRDGSSG